MQYLASLVANENGGGYYRIVIDIGNYREKRESTLEALAKRTAGQVLRTGRSRTLEPMNPYERRIIHTEVQAIEGVESERIGAILEPNIQQAAQYISEHFREDISLADVAAQAYMSESHFSRKFKKITGLNFSEYLTSTRIKAADDLLLQTSMSIAEIAAACGFGDANYFGDIFKKHKGMSPTKYRRMRR